MHILYIGWAEHVHLRRWAAFFAKMGHQVTILTNSERFEPLENARIIKLKTRKRLVRFQADEVRLWTAVLRPDVCHVHWATFGHILRKVRRCPVGITVWGSDIYKLSTYDDAVQRNTREALASAAFITCDSLDLKDRIIRLVGDGRSEVELIQWGVDTDIFRPMAKDNGIRARFGIPEGVSVVLSMRNVTPIYNPETIIEAFGILASRRNDVVLLQKHYHAREDRLKELKVLVDKMGLGDRVFWIGDMKYEDLPLLYNASNVVVSVPDSDGTPMTLLEAMACGIPPVVSDLPSVREWIGDGRNGIIVPLKDPRALASALEKLLGDQDLRLRISGINTQLVMSRARHDFHMSRMEDVYRRVSDSLASQVVRA